MSLTETNPLGRIVDELQTKNVLLLAALKSIQFYADGCCEGAGMPEFGHYQAICEMANLARAASNK